MSIRQSEPPIAIIREDGVFVCAKERCGRRFDNEVRAREHWARMHGKASITPSASTIQMKDHPSSEKDDDQQLKLPLINASQVKVSNSSSIQQKQMGLHTSIRSVQETLTEPGKRPIRKVLLIPEKKAVALNQNQSNATSRPSSSNSSTFNTTSSSLKDSQFAKSGVYSGQEDLLTSAASLQQVKLPQKQTIDSKISRNSVSINKQPATATVTTVPGADAIKRSKEEILFGKRDTLKQQQKKLDSDDEEIESEKQDAILQMKFSDDEEEIETEGQENDDKLISAATADPEQKSVVLTMQMILDSTGCSDLQEVEQLIIRKKNINGLVDSDDLDWSELSAIWYLGVTHHPSLSDISGIANIPNRCLIELNLEYNAIESIKPLLRHTQLQKLYLSGNKITSIIGINQLASLKTLCLMKNRIRGFDDSLEALAMLVDLQELELEQNPISSRFNYKYDILWQLKVKKLDGEMVTDLDIELSRTFQRDYIAFCRDNQQQAGGMKRPVTAVPRNQVSYKDRFKMKVIDAPTVSVSENKEEQLDQQIADALEAEEALERELLDLQLQGRSLREQQQELDGESRSLAAGINEYSALQQQRVQMTAKYKEYVANLNQNASQFIKGIFKLNLRIDELLAENVKLTLENEQIQQDLKQSQGDYQMMVGQQKQQQQQSKADTAVKTTGQAVYDDCVDLESDDEDQTKMKRNAEDEDDDDDDDDGDGCDDAPGLDIGFDSDDLDEETKEIKKMLEDNEKSLKQVKRQLNEI